MLPGGLHTVNNCNGTSSSGFVDLTGSCFSVGTRRVMTDVVTPGFKKIQGNGGTVFTSMVKTVETRTASAGGTTRTRIGNCTAGSVASYQYAPGTLHPAIGLPAYKAGPDVERMRDEARTAALANAKTPALMSLVDIAEAKKTVLSLASLAKDFYKTSMAIGTGARYVAWLKRNNAFASRANLIKFISSHWLEYRYMFVPIFLSANSILEIYQKSQPPVGGRQTYRSSVTSSTSDNEKKLSSTLNSQGNWRTDFYASFSTQVTVRGGCLQQILTAKCLSTQLGLDRRYVGQAMWEYLTFSFLYDWFANIGDYVAAVSPDVGSKILGVWTTSEETATINWRAVTTYVGTGWNHQPATSFGMTQNVTTTRVAGGSAALTLRTFQGKWIDLIHLADASALLAQFGGKPRARL